MINEKSKQCKSKGCYNPVLDGKYCVNCKQKRKEKGGKMLAGAGGFAVLGLGIARKKGVMKKVPKITAKLMQVILKK